MKIKFDMIHEFIEATGYDWGSFCVFTKIPSARMRQIAEGADDVTKEEWLALAEGIEAYPQILVDNSN